MAKLSFAMSAPEPPKPLFPIWFRVSLYAFVISTCAILILTFASQGR